MKKENAIKATTVFLIYLIDIADFIWKLKAVADITPSEYIITMKLNEVKRLLCIQPPMTFLDIAIRSGFADNAHMTHAFKQKFGVSPSQFLKQTSAEEGDTPE